MRKAVGILLALILLSSCSDNAVFSNSTSFSNGWKLQDTVQVQLPVLDSVTNYDLFLTVRNSNDYPFNNLFLIVAMEFPQGKVITDTLEYRMANPDGSWMGTGVGSIKESKLWYKEGVRFLEGGNYKLSIVHALRNNGQLGGVEDLQGILEVGLRIEESGKE
ncbi:MAG: gliding motility lipoprotein GldH [Gilvibacter sp.]